MLSEKAFTSTLHRGPCRKGLLYCFEPWIRDPRIWDSFDGVNDIRIDKSHIGTYFNTVFLTTPLFRR